jgi:hypothetical protein
MPLQRHVIHLGVFTAIALLTASSQQVVILCALGDMPLYSAAGDHQPTPLAQREFSAAFVALCPKGCGNVALVRNFSAGNALTMSVAPGASKIAYNPQFMQLVLTSFGEPATLAIFAHELGHHLDSFGLAGWMDHQWGKELRADAWSGCALARLHLTTQEIDRAMGALAQFPSMSHPGWNLRIPAIRQGYVACGGTRFGR